MITVETDKRGNKNVRINDEYVARDCHRDARVTIVERGGSKYLMINDEYVEEVDRDEDIYEE